MLKNVEDSCVFYKIAHVINQVRKTKTLTECYTFNYFVQKWRKTKWPNWAISLICFMFAPSKNHRIYCGFLVHRSKDIAFLDSFCIGNMSEKTLGFCSINILQHLVCKRRFLLTVFCKPHGFVCRRHIAASFIAVRFFKPVSVWKAQYQVNTDWIFEPLSLQDSMSRASQHWDGLSQTMQKH